MSVEAAARPVARALTGVENGVFKVKGGDSGA
jgi:hypothetical protein